MIDICFDGWNNMTKAVETCCGQGMLNISVANFITFHSLSLIDCFCFHQVDVVPGCIMMHCLGGSSKPVAFHCGRMRRSRVPKGATQIENVSVRYAV